MRIKLKPARIDLYLVGEILGPLLGGVLFFTFIFLMSQVLRLSDFLIIHGVPLPILGKMTGLLIVSFLPVALPVAFLIAVLVGFGRLSADSELVAMKACGISIWRLSAPIFVLAALVTVVSLVLNLEWVPQAQRNFKATLIRVGNQKIVNAIQEGTFTSGFFDMLIYADRVDPETHRLEGVFIYDERDQKNPMTVVAREGEVVRLSRPEDLSTRAYLLLYNGNIHRNDIEAGTYQKVDFGVYRLFLKIDEGAEDNSYEKPRYLIFGELLRRIKGGAGGDAKLLREYRAELWRRITDAITPVIFVLIGVGFGTVRTRTVRAGALLVSTVVIVVYWAAQTSATVLAQKEGIPVSLVLWLPQMILLVPGILSARKAAW